jgi:hypothetical protein
MSKKINPISSEKGQYGQWIHSAIVDGERVHHQYFGYTKKESLKLFKEFLNDKER